MAPIRPASTWLGDTHSEIARAQRFVAPSATHVELLRRIALEWVEAAGSLCDLINHELHQHSKYVSFELFDSPDLKAQAFSGGNDGGGDIWHATISLAWLPRVFGLANRVISPINPTSTAFMVEMQKWDWRENNPGITTAYGPVYDAMHEQAVHDVLTLALLHEIGHGLEGHMGFSPTTAFQHQAMEACADQVAGVLFGALGEALPTPKNTPESGPSEDLLVRGARAAWVLGTFFHLAGRGSPEYPHPTLRLNSILAGLLEARPDLRKSGWEEATVVLGRMMHPMTLILGIHPEGGGWSLEMGPQRVDREMLRLGPEMLNLREFQDRLKARTLIAFESWRARAAPPA